MLNKILLGGGCNSLSGQTLTYDLTFTIEDQSANHEQYKVTSSSPQIYIPNYGYMRIIEAWSVEGFYDAILGSVDDATTLWIGGITYSKYKELIDTFTLHSTSSGRNITFYNSDLTLPPDGRLYLGRREYYIRSDTDTKHKLTIKFK